MRIQGGMSQSIEVEGRGQSIAILFSQPATSAVAWTFDVYARTPEGRAKVGTVVTNPPGVGLLRPVDPPVRVVALAGVPGATSWDVQASSPGAEQAEAWIVASDALICNGLVQPIVGTSGRPGGSCEMRALDLTADVINDMFPGVAALGLGWDAAAQVWRKIAVNGLGQLLVSVIVAGSSVDTSAATPTDPGGSYLGTAAEGYAWDASTGFWVKVPAVQTAGGIAHAGGKFVGVASDLFIFDPVGNTWRPAPSVTTTIGAVHGGSIVQEVADDLFLWDATGFGQWVRAAGLATGEQIVSRIDGSATLTYLGALTDVTPAAAGVAHSAGTIAGAGKYENLTFIGELAGATGGALVVRVQDKPRAASADYYDLAAFPSVPLGQAAAESIFRMHAALTGVPNKIGKNDAPKLVAGTISGGAWGDTLRSSYEALAGTSAGVSVTVYYFGSKLR